MKNRITRRDFMKALGASAAVLGLSACGAASSSAAGTASSTAAGGSAAAGGELPILGAAIYSASDNFNTYLATAIEKNAAGNFKCTVEEAQNDQGKMNNEVDAMIAKGAKAIALSLVDVSAAQTIIQKAKDAGNLPVIFFNKEVTDTSVLAGYDNVYQVLSTAGGYGADIEAQEIAAAFKGEDGTGVKVDKNDDGTLQFVMLMGSADHTATIPRAQAIYDGLDAAGIPYKELACDYGDWDTATAKEKMDAWVSKYGDEIEFVICANDAMAIGALQSIEAAGFNAKGYDSEKYIPVVGIDALPDTLNYIDSGEIYCSVLQDSSTQGSLVVKVASNLVNGKNPLDGLDGYELEADTKAIRVPYKAINQSNTAEAAAGYAS